VALGAIAVDDTIHEALIIDPQAEEEEASAWGVEQHHPLEKQT
jgi:hypothetical protein